ncbi:MAG: glycosyltransferase [Verrucomicrobiota bacterium]|nr:glycosyltransferase [Verrucomicrobiota bacterium]
MSNSNGLNQSFPIIVHCHLRWEGVWQRPQQFLSRLSANHPVLFVEGPILRDGDEAPNFTLNQVSDYPNVTVMQSFFPTGRFHDGAWVDAERLRLLREALSGPLKGKFVQPVQWFYDPMAAPCFIDKIDEIAVVYDCMDELSQFKFAPPEIIKRERFLLEHADVVFAGGNKLWQSKKRYNSNAYFYGCGVDVPHFSKARLTETEVPADIRNIARPTLGYFGVVDERLDYELIEKLALAADWNILMVGPAVKVDPNALPQHPRIHWLGRREYAQLPNYTKGFDVCLMPFALNEATEFINPTKALEYMATGRMIVSSAVPDVVSNFSQVVKIADSHEQFIQFCKDAVHAPDRTLIERGIKMATENQWHMIVAKLEGHIADVLGRAPYAEKRNEPLTLTTA